jgi:hypothetical protein
MTLCGTRTSCKVNLVLLQLQVVEAVAEEGVVETEEEEEEER